ncbi:MAG TPA: glycoside hydrolase family 95 protein [Eudoraea sp.]|nr:glycoside hydrolase family 95 protein [Eudoraea sp.]
MKHRERKSWTVFKNQIVMETMDHRLFTSLTRPEYYIMKRSILVFLSLMICAVPLKITAQSDKVMWYDKPANYFEETLVLGNGTMGASIFGGINNEKIYLNDATLWSGEPVKPNSNPETYKAVEQVRKALEQENYQLADKLQRKLQGPYSQSYMPLGTLFIHFENTGDYTDYYRELDIGRAMAKVSYKSNDINYLREYFISYPDQIMVIRLTANKKKSINCTINFESLLKFKTEKKGNSLEVNGYAPYNVEPNYIQNNPDPIQFDENRGTRFTSTFSLESNDGKIVTTDSTLTLSKSSEAIIYVSIATSFNGYDKDPATEGKDDKAIAQENLEKACEKSYSTLKKDHLTDYQALFDRLELTLEASGKAELPTDKRLLNYSEGAEDKSLEELYFNYGRYLFIASSRTDGVPANLQGIWNPHLRPPWSSNYTVNINVEENYWLAETANLSELHMPLLKFIANAATTGKNSAQTYYGTRGWVVCHNSDIWAMSNPVGEHTGDPNWANWNMGGVWLSTHLWEHYLFTQDRSYLTQEAYPLMKSAVVFCLDWLVKDKNGNWITSPGTSPENTYITPEGYKGATLYGATSDLAMIRELFKNFIRASETLDIENDFREKVQAVYDHLYPYQIGKKGNLQEWHYDWEDENHLHRHQSHLFGLYPGHHITPEETPELAYACRTSLEIKGDKTTGWSKGWRINLWARLGDGNRAYKMYRELLNYVDPDGMNGSRRGGGTYPNLFDAHPPFQIDGNFGGAAAIVEMLLQSRDGKIFLLPALPDTWENGAIKGVCARGGFEISMQWENNQLIKSTIKAKVDGKPIIIYNGKQQEIELKKGQTSDVIW